MKTALIFGLLSIALTASAEQQTLRLPVDPVMDEAYGKLLCGTKWLMFETDDPNAFATVTFDGGASFPANRLLNVGDSTLITLRQNGRSVSYDVAFDENSHNEAFRPELGLVYCRFKMP